MCFYRAQQSYQSSYVEYNYIKTHEHLALNSHIINSPFRQLRLLPATKKYQASLRKGVESTQKQPSYKEKVQPNARRPRFKKF